MGARAHRYMSEFSKENSTLNGTRHFSVPFKCSAFGSIPSELPPLRSLPHISRAELIIIELYMRIYDEKTNDTAGIGAVLRRVTRFAVFCIRTKKKR